MQHHISMAILYGIALLNEMQCLKDHFAQWQVFPITDKQEKYGIPGGKNGKHRNSHNHISLDKSKIKKNIDQTDSKTT